MSILRYSSSFVVCIFLLLACSNPLSSSQKNMQYTISYLGNGNTNGSCPYDYNKYLRGEKIVIQDKGTLEKVGYTFVGWNSKQDCTGNNYIPGSSIEVVESNITLYANWSLAPTYKITYNGNDQTNGEVPVDDNCYLENSTAIVKGNTGNLVKYGFVFSDWNTSPNGTGNSYTPNSEIKILQNDITLYAIWAKGVTIFYNGNGATGGTVPNDSNTYSYNDTAQVLPNSGNLTISGKIIAGWNTKPDATGQSYGFYSAIPLGSADITLYAIWIQNTLTIESNWNGINLTGYTVKPSGDFVVPNGITKIDYLAFTNCSDLTTITIPSTVINFDKTSLYSCPMLRSIFIHSDNNKYKSIDGVLFSKDGAQLILFPQNNDITEYVIPNGVNTISPSAFSGCKKITSVVFPDTVKELLGGAFFDCSLLNNVVLSSELEIIDSYAFATCPFSSIILPSNLKEIRSFAFYNCYRLVSITIPSSVIMIGDNPFINCGNLTSIIVETGNSLYKSIADALYNINVTDLIAFPAGKTGSYTLPDTVIKLRANSLQVSRLSSINISPILQTIESGALYSLNSITSITLPATVTSIGAQAISGWMLNSVTMSSIIPPTINPINNFTPCTSDFRIHVPVASLDTYKTANGWSDFTSFIVAP